MNHDSNFPLWLLQTQESTVADFAWKMDIAYFVNKSTFDS